MVDCFIIMWFFLIGEDLNDSECFKGKLVVFLKLDLFVFSFIMIVRRVFKKELIVM